MMNKTARWTIYARRAGHKKFHPCAPSLGLYRCQLAQMDRYASRREAEAVRSTLSHEHADFTFTIRYLRNVTS